jgi:hypothetical protein
MRRAFVLTALLVVAGCSAKPEGEVASGAPTVPASAEPRILGRCCPDTDAELMALMQRYEDTPEAERSPELALWAYRMTSGIPEQERIIVRDSAAWTALWPRIVGTHSPRPKPPAVDFAKEMLLVVSMGTRSSGGYVIAIDSLRVAGDSIRVVVREQSPGPRCGTTAALSAPVALARVERSDLPVSFTTRAVVKDCT